MDEEKKAEEKVLTKNKIGESMPFCTEAPSAEHARAHEEDEPCYDYREGK